MSILPVILDHKGRTIWYLGGGGHGSFWKKKKTSPTVETKKKKKSLTWGVKNKQTSSIWGVKQKKKPSQTKAAKKKK